MNFELVVSSLQTFDYVAGARFQVSADSARRGNTGEGGAFSCRRLDQGRQTGEGKHQYKYFPSIKYLITSQAQKHPQHSTEYSYKHRSPYNAPTTTFHPSQKPQHIDRKAPEAKDLAGCLNDTRHHT